MSEIKSMRSNRHHLVDMPVRLPLSCKVLVLAIFFNKSSSTPGIDAAGLLSAVVGLVLFLEGLRVAIMPMALLVGN